MKSTWKFALVLSCCLRLPSSAFGAEETERLFEVFPVGTVENKNKPPAGVFASRSPVRPNLIALSVCRILSVEGNTVRVASIDAFDGTPILDIKPYIPMIDSPSNASLPEWWTPPGPGGSGGQRGGGQGQGGPGGPGDGDLVERVMGFDANGDGALDKEEVEKIAEQGAQRGAGQPRGGR